MLNYPWITQSILKHSPAIAPADMLAMLLDEYIRRGRRLFSRHNHSVLAQRLRDYIQQPPPAGVKYQDWKVHQEEWLVKQFNELSLIRMNKTGDMFSLLQTFMSLYPDFSYSKDSQRLQDDVIEFFKPTYVFIDPEKEYDRIVQLNSPMDQLDWQTLAQLSRASAHLQERFSFLLIEKILKNDLDGMQELIAFKDAIPSQMISQFVYALLRIIKQDPQRLPDGPATSELAIKVLQAIETIVPDDMVEPIQTCLMEKMNKTLLDCIAIYAKRFKPRNDIISKLIVKYVSQYPKYLAQHIGLLNLLFSLLSDKSRINTIYVIQTIAVEDINSTFAAIVNIIPLLPFEAVEMIVDHVILVSGRQKYLVKHLNIFKMLENIYSGQTNNVSFAGLLVKEPSKFANLKDKIIRFLAQQLQISTTAMESSLASSTFQTALTNQLSPLYQQTVSQNELLQPIWHFDPNKRAQDHIQTFLLDTRQHLTVSACHRLPFIGDLSSQMNAREKDQFVLRLLRFVDIKQYDRQEVPEHVIQQSIRSTIKLLTQQASPSSIHFHAVVATLKSFIVTPQPFPNMSPTNLTNSILKQLHAAEGLEILLRDHPGITHFVATIETLINYRLTSLSAGEHTEHYWKTHPNLVPDMPIVGLVKAAIACDSDSKHYSRQLLLKHTAHRGDECARRYFEEMKKDGVLMYATQTKDNGHVNHGLDEFILQFYRLANDYLKKNIADYIINDLNLKSHRLFIHDLTEKLPQNPDYQALKQRFMIALQQRHSALDNTLIGAACHFQRYTYLRSNLFPRLNVTDKKNAPLFELVSGYLGPRW